MPDFRRGADAVAKAQQKAKSGGNFSPFAPEIFWQKDKDERYLLFLNPMSEIPTVDMISFIPQVRKKGDGEKFTVYERVIARTDAAIGEDSDAMEDDWQGKPRDTCVAVAVELEPTLEDVRGRMRPTGFTIKTNTYERKVRDDDGKVTDEIEEVVTPIIGFIHASPHNFFNVVAAYDSSESEIERTPVKITRVGSGTDTVYTVTGYEDQTVDLTPLLEEIEGVSYLPEEDMNALVAAVDAADSDEDAALIIGEVMLDKRLEELADPDRYEKLYESITETLDKWAKDKKSTKGSGRKASSTRPSRRSSRRSAEPTVEEAEEVKADVEADAAEPEKAKPARTRTRKAAPKAEKKAEEAPSSDPTGKLDRLRKRAEDAKAAKTTA